MSGVLAGAAAIDFGPMNMTADKSMLIEQRIAFSLVECLSPHPPLTVPRCQRQECWRVGRLFKESAGE
jgi:hypothetical protein